MKNMMKIIAIGVIFIFLFGSSFSLQAMEINRGMKHKNLQLSTTSVPLNNGKTLYVGGTGPDNYTRIQEAIDNASNGDTVFVFDDSSPYNELIIINITINLIGENKETTIITGEGNYWVLLTINAENCLIKDLSFQNTSNCAIGINCSSGCKIINNILYGCNFGIALLNSSYCVISDNQFSQCVCNSVSLWENNNYNTITGNIFEIGGMFGAVFSDYTCCYNNVSYNLFDKNIFGMLLSDSHNWRISYNTFKMNEIGILLSVSTNNVISCNNFQFNIIRNAMFFYKETKNKWSRNYWNRPRVLPKVISGFELIVEGRVAIPIPIVDLENIDWHPAKKPYDIHGNIPEIVGVNLNSRQNNLSGSSSQQSAITGSSSQADLQSAVSAGSLKVNVKHAVFKTLITDACVAAIKLKNIETNECYYMYPDGMGIYENYDLPIDVYFVVAGKEGYTTDGAIVIIEEGKQTTHTFYIKPEDDAGYNIESTEILVDRQQDISQQSFHPTSNFIHQDSDFLWFQSSQPSSI